MQIETQNSELQAPLGRTQRGALIVGLAGLVLCVLGAFLSLDQFLQSYLWAYLFWLGIALGCVGVVMVQHLAGGGWGVVIRRLLEAGAMTLPLMAVLFLPVLLGPQYLYTWAQPEVVRADELLQHKQPYLNVPFFVIRAVLYFAIWIGMAYILNRWSHQQDRTADPALARRLRLLSAGGLVLYFVTMTFASFDWAMSLDPHWYSTIYGALFVIGQVLTTLAFVITILALLSDREPLSRAVTANHFNDLGNLLLAFVMLWAYMSFSQFLIIWAGNLPEEVVWYLQRTTGGWAWIPPILIIFHFALPFLLLLQRGAKRRPRVLAGIAVGIICMHLLNLFWLVMPAFHADGLHVHWLDLAAPLGIGGLWIAAFVWLLRRKPLLPLHDPRWHVEEAH